MQYMLIEISLYVTLYSALSVLSTQKLDKKYVFVYLHTLSVLPFLTKKHRHAQSFGITVTKAARVVKATYTGLHAYGYANAAFFLRPGTMMGGMAYTFSAFRRSVKLAMLARAIGGSSPNCYSGPGDNRTRRLSLVCDTYTAFANRISCRCLTAFNECELHKKLIIQ